MSFFGNIKKATVSTAKAISNGVELLDELADGVQKSSELLLIKTQASSLENDINHLISNSADLIETSEKRKALSKKYDEIIAKTLDSEKDEYVRKNNSLKKEIELSSINSIEKRVANKEQELSSHDFNLAITEIRKLESIKKDLEHLLRITQPKQHEAAHQKALEKINSIISRVTDLQEKRHEEIISNHPSGEKKYKVKLYDGEKHGMSEFWYENGTKEKEISFSHGELIGTSRYWRNDGTILSEISSQPMHGTYIHSAFARNGTKIMKSSLKNKQGHIDIWLWDGSFVCRAKIKNNKVNKLSAFVRSVMRKRIWVAIYSARKPGLEQDMLNEMEQTVEVYTKFSNELLSHLTYGKVS
ncbi:hypothetical protein FEI13_17650 [Halomonas urmiana]|uniref:Uncharacterized protein n=1 Tax=Halomonas urmiana TaxID=490901 RepID=A0A5R8MB20_9GAMM|nr:hypothetical protein [Halomonas urmiana]TLF45939.1 hypothetical protein FEI13_17650 [Halomonas urmiana]